MSLLGTQVYANPDTPCWISSTGGEVTGDLTVDGNLTVNMATNLNGPLNANSDVNVGATLFFAPPTGDEQAITVDPLGTILYIQGGNSVKFGKLGQTTTNTTLTLAAPGSGLDLFTTNFLSANGPIPTVPVPIGANPAVALPTGSNTRTGTFGLTTSYTIISNATYDIQATGILTWTAGNAPAAGDQVSASVKIGSANAAQATALYYPGNAPFTWASNVGNPFSIRARLVAAGTVTSNIVCGVGFTGNVSTGEISGVLNYLDVVRVA